MSPDYVTWPDPGGDDRVVIRQRIERASDGLHPLDGRKLRYIVEALQGVAHRDFIAGLVAELMVCVRPDCSATGDERVTDRLIHGLVGTGLDSGEIAEIVLAKIQEARP